MASKKDSKRSQGGELLRSALRLCAFFLGIVASTALATPDVFTDDWVHVVRYEGSLGYGDYGVVWEGVLDSGRHVAVKFAHAGEAQLALAEQTEEVQKLYELAAPLVGATYAARPHGESPEPALVTALVRGKTLRQLRRAAKPIPRAAVYELARRVRAVIVELGLFPWDGHDGNFVYGSLAFDDEPRFYFVDPASIPLRFVSDDGGWNVFAKTLRHAARLANMSREETRTLVATVARTLVREYVRRNLGTLRGPALRAHLFAEGCGHRIGARRPTRPDHWPHAPTLVH